MKVTKRNGLQEELSVDKLNAVVMSACEGLDANPSDVLMNAKLQLFDGIKTSKIHELLVKSAIDLISIKQSDYQFVASKLFSFLTRKQVFGVYYKDELPTVKDLVVTNIGRGLYDPNILSKWTDEDFEEFQKTINHDNDDKLTISAYMKMYDTYLAKDRTTGYVYETPQFAFMVLSLALYDTVYDVIGHYKQLVNRKISLPTPIMAGMRTPTRQYASCFPYDQEVFNADGSYEQISNIKKGDRVLTHLGNEKTVLATQVKPYTGDIVSLNTTLSFRNRLKPTAEHLFYTIKKENKKIGIAEWVKASEISIGDYIIAPYNKHTHNTTELSLYDTLVDEENNKYFILNENDGKVYKPTSDKRCRSGKYNDRVYPVTNNIKLNGDIFRLIGYYLAEGSAHGTCVDFTFNVSDMDYLEDIKNIIHDNFGIPSKISVSNFDNSARLVVHSRLFKLFMTKMCGIHSTSKFLDNIVLNADKNLQKELLRGVLRGDGCIHKNGVVLALTNKPLIIQLGNIFLRNGIGISYTTIKQNGTSKESYGIHLGRVGNMDFLNM
ncbi:ribonucleoside-diphosphate reductase subunit alpha/intein splicing domain [Tenacibaculum phage PTm1]|uniref:Ribonucleoside-diphosphate reductase subunit alpha/intein splicing domain n=2 Tax=Shirahamavirus PTm1 TaxID=2846435 RepID=A0A5S9BYZ6_9CAUD|nr:ribonucleoside-diphosphate reductase subunit alpha/intein splicing domain [Tenacibaculum phage PTm1]BBI90440.1 ribonucleoside-diphosphate reductase subunit alpha/intein splicing domain [Tenacibaculum phage PTm1]BBI90747.1 ribonucleoside-diphosphate reductase subunit alpha/intein splicing domain [Tenacibaculum phage PTm5]